MGPFGYLVSKVLHLKKTYKNFAGLDSSMANLMRPALYGSYHHISVMDKENQELNTQYDVTGASYYVHTKRGAEPDTPKTMRVDYQVGWNTWQSEWVCPEHTGYARGKFEGWWRKRSNEPFPDSAEAAVQLAETGCLAETTSITVRSVSGEKFDTIIGYELGSIPPRADGSDERDGGDLPAHDWIDDADVPF